MEDILCWHLDEYFVSAVRLWGVGGGLVGLRFQF